METTPDPFSSGVHIVDSGHRRKLDVAVEVPKDELGAVASNEMWSEIYDRLAQLIHAHRTTLVFVNTRRLAERVTHHLAERLGESAVLAHHGSLSRRLRLMAEERLKSGELRAVVATASLELGIDIGSVDLGLPDRVSPLDWRSAATDWPIGPPCRSVQCPQRTAVCDHAR